MKRLLVLPFVSSIVVCCGQTIDGEPPGTALPDGAFVGADGGLVFQSGAACVSFDSAQYAGINSLLCTKTGEDSECYSTAATHVPPGFPIIGICIGNIGRCEFGHAYGPSCPASRTVYCHVGSEGDAFCSGFYSQFVRDGGSVRANCVSSCGGAADYDGTCAPDWSCTQTGDADTSCDVLGLCVDRNDTIACEQPCASL